ncbi:MAG: hypothetical protein ACLRMN_07485 [Mediterraneibacter gnavus]
MTSEVESGKVGTILIKELRSRMGKRLSESFRTAYGIVMTVKNVHRLISSQRERVTASGMDD